jgi:hypothetical protein
MERSEACGVEVEHHAANAAQIVRRDGLALDMVMAMSVLY